MKKSFLAKLLVCCMAFMLLTSTAFAAEGDTVLADLENGNNVTLTEDISVGRGFVINDKSVVLDLAGHTISVADDTRIWTGGGNDDTWSIFSVRGTNGSLTIKDSGATPGGVDMTNTAYDDGEDGPDGYIIDVRDGANAVIDCPNGTKMIGAECSTYAYVGTITIKGGTHSCITHWTGYGDHVFVLNCKDEFASRGEAKILVESGVFVGVDPRDTKGDTANPTNYVATGSEVTSVEKAGACVGCNKKHSENYNVTVYTVAKKSVDLSGCDVQEITESADISKENMSEVTVRFELSANSNLQWFEAGGVRPYDGWWIGFKAIAPTMVNEGALTSVRYRNNNSADDKDTFATSNDGQVDGKYWIGLWGGINEAVLKNAAAAGKDELTYVWYFNWDGNDSTGTTIEAEKFSPVANNGVIPEATAMEGVDQIITLTFKLSEIKELSKNGAVVWQYSSEVKAEFNEAGAYEVDGTAAMGAIAAASGENPEDNSAQTATIVVEPAANATDVTVEIGAEVFQTAANVVANNANTSKLNLAIDAGDVGGVTLDTDAIKTVVGNDAVTKDTKVTISIEDKTPTLAAGEESAPAKVVEIKVTSDGTNLLPIKSAGTNGTITITIPVSGESASVWYGTLADDGKFTPETKMDATFASGKATFTTNHLSAYAVYSADPVTGVKLNYTNLALKENVTRQLTPTLEPTGTNGTATYGWTSSNESVATVDANGLVTAVKEGTATITVTATVGGETFTATCIITVDETAEPTPANELKVEIGEAAAGTIGHYAAISGMTAGKLYTVQVRNGLTAPAAIFVVQATEGAMTMQVNAGCTVDVWEGKVTFTNGTPDTDGEYATATAK